MNSISADLKPLDSEPGVQPPLLPVPRRIPGGLTPREIFWHDHQPDWVPSWIGTDKTFLDAFDGTVNVRRRTLDEIRIQDNAGVALKLLQKSVHFKEVDGEDPRNYCVPIFEVLEVPDDEDFTILVMPLLRKYYQPRFDTVGEAVDFFGQIFEGLGFIHNYNVAHRFESLLGPSPLEPPIHGGDKTVPEHQMPADPCDPCDPFSTDVYYLGNMIRREFIEGHDDICSKLSGFEFMRPLMDDMVVARFATIRAGLSSWKLRSRVVKETDMPLPILRAVKHWYQRIGYILTRTLAIPC
ncbi:hypothetical protein B0H17DRAFT_1164387 [Mycena rosella]|uniref:Protein kinase domain-containing protein n=1 Tax=Mycena rosella TaxID=1033263 RepID=A0AAD7BN51_MYCRO|nr:hypothetical protein B0H17DRAFT_1164387 [Mycena rosella]